ncbi:unnamed protein product [Mytilus coruscus]|uniref:Fibronectin type-III domain-containing protein n=1 Tax=Mytilus coruscus TaxID=42192 RepID=A0A6J8E8D3_MYTCO|nr:unnamed protein product [Mytilus coruscus]
MVLKLGKLAFVSVVGCYCTTRYELVTSEPLSAPQNIKAVALHTQIIVKWTDNHDIGLQGTFFVEYRKHFESQWSRVSAEDKFTAIINGLQPGAVYFLRVYSKNAAGESSKSDVIIVKTGSSFHGGIGYDTWSDVFKDGYVLVWNKSRGTLPRRNDETSTRPVHYDEIDSMYYNPINSTVSHQDTRNNTQNCILQPLNANLEDWEANNISSRNVHCAVHQFKPSQENNSLRSSSDESYLVPCRNYIDLDNVKITENEHHDISIEETAINVDELSISSNNSETNIKIIRRYETLNVSDINEHCYKTYISPNQ